MTPEERTVRLAQCLTEVKALRRTSEALHTALTLGDTAGVQSLAEAQEIRIWRIGRILSLPETEGVPLQEDEAEGEPDPLKRDQVEEALRSEMYTLADVSRVNARLLEDGIKMSRALLQMLSGAAEESGNVWRQEDSRARVFSRRA